MRVSNYPVSILPLSGQHVNFPVTFHVIIGVEQRNGKSPSIFNQLEIKQVLLYVNVLLSANISDPVKPNDIGVITP